jgi:peptidoglycan/LPS O-acetylase OafA/YrhL
LNAHSSDAPDLTSASLRAAFHAAAAPRKTAGGWTVHRWIPAIEALRGVAALSVIIGHAVGQVSPTAEGAAISPLQTLFSWLGSWGVALFFVLSGFCIHLPQATGLAQRGELRSPAWGAFYARRCRRLLPTHYAALILSALVGLRFEANLVHPPTLPAFLAHVFMVHTWWAVAFYSINGVLWTIAIEFHFYFAYPIYLAVRRRLGPIGTTVAMLVVGLFVYGVGTKLLAGSPSRIVVQNLFVVYWWQWAFGAALAELYASGRKPSWAPLFTGSAARWVWGLLSLALAFTDIVVFRLHIRFWLLPAFCGMFLLSTIVRPWRSTPLRAALSRAGLISYSLYLIHPIALALAADASRGLPGAVRILLLIVLSVLCAGVFFLIFERPFLPQRTGTPAAAPALAAG